MRSFFPEKINCDRTASSFVNETQLVRYVNVTIGNKRRYKNKLIASNNKEN